MYDRKQQSSNNGRPTHYTPTYHTDHMRTQQLTCTRWTWHSRDNPGYCAGNCAEQHSAHSTKFHSTTKDLVRLTITSRVQSFLIISVVIAKQLHLHECESGASTPGTVRTIRSKRCDSCVPKIQKQGQWTAARTMVLSVLSHTNWLY